ncbi:hypothetical protein PG995_012491 [Apiospora arundinis]
MYAPSVFTAVFFALATAQRPAAVQREAFDAKCTKALQDVLPIYALVPTPPPALESIPMPTNPCDAPTFKNDRNNTLSAQYVSYTSKVSVWYKSHSSDILAALSQCPDLVSVAAEGPFCSTTSTTSTSSSIVTPKPSPTAPTAAPKAPRRAGQERLRIGRRLGLQRRLLQAFRQAGVERRPSRFGGRFQHGHCGGQLPGRRGRLVEAAARLLVCDVFDTYNYSSSGLGRHF